MNPIQLIDPKRLQQALEDVVKPIELHYYTSDVHSWYSYAEKQLLYGIAAASKHLSLRVHAGQWDELREAEVKIARTPAIALYGEYDTGIRYYGMPDGYELDLFLGTLTAVSSGNLSLRPETIERARGIESPLHLEVIALPT